jgi:hypothetical protein
MKINPLNQKSGARKVLLPIKPILKLGYENDTFL